MVLCLTQMNSNDRNDIKTSLRKMEFPYCAREALAKAGELLSSSNASHTDKQHFIKLSEIAKEIISEFVFNEVDRRGGRKKLTCLQEFELMQVITDHITLNKSDQNNLILLSTLFPSHLPDRRKFLVSLISMSISTKNEQVMEVMAMVLDQMGFTSQFSSSFAQMLVAEFPLLMAASTVPCPVRDLPNVSAFFMANFLASLSEVYGYNEVKKRILLPPKYLRKLILHWLTEFGSISLVSIHPVHYRSMDSTPLTSHSVLFKWCILAELTEPSEFWTSLWSRVKACIKQSYCRLNTPEIRIISADYLSTVSLPFFNMNWNVHRLEKAIDVLAQTINLGIRRNVLYGNKEKLRWFLKKLPASESVKDVIGLLETYIIPA